MPDAHKILKQLNFSLP